MSCKLKKNTWDPSSPLFLSYFNDCVMITNVWFWYFYIIYLRLEGIYRVGPPSGYFKSFVLSFLFFLFFFFSFLFFIIFFFFLSQSWGAPLASGPLDIVHLCRPVATPLQWRSEDVRGPWTTDSPGPLLMLNNLIPLTPSATYTPTQTLYTSLLYDFNQYTHLMDPFDGAMGEMGAPWWRNDKWDPLIMWWEIRGHNGPWWRNDELGPLGNVMGNRGRHHSDDMIRNMGAVDSAMENVGPFDDAMGKLETLN